MNATSTSLKNRIHLILGVLAMTISGQTAHGASLFGDHSCQHWHGLGYGEKRAWTNAFLAPLSLTIKGLQKSKEDKYNDDPKAYEAAIMNMDAFCLSHPELSAPDAAGQYLKKLFEMPQ
jgi:hypothetical protein